MQQDLHPPTGLLDVGPGGVEVGEHFLRYFIELGGLRPHHRVLDIGSGVGRMAIPLGRYLQPGGSYEGFDVVANAVAWCNEHISAGYPHMVFRHADLYNPEYNPTGHIHASDYVFPYESGSFDFVFATSVFTHLLSEDADHYIGEIARVLKLGGCCLTTFFLLNDEARTLVASGRSTWDFKFPARGCWALVADRPEAAVAYDESAIAALFEKHRLLVREPVRYGVWPGRASAWTFQDMIIAERRGGAA